LIFAPAVLAAFGLETAIETEVEERREAGVGAQDHVPAAPAVAPARSPPGPVLLAQEGDAAATSVARLDRHARLVDEPHDDDELYRSARRANNRRTFPGGASRSARRADNRRTFEGGCPEGVPMGGTREGRRTKRLESQQR
jgi:hypothetical protein